jgi:hypothetical protein
MAKSMKTFKQALQEGFNFNPPEPEDDGLSFEWSFPGYYDFTFGDKKNNDILNIGMSRYNFYNIFGINPQTGDIYPLFNTRINGAFFQQYYSIPKGPSFGGIDIYRLIGRDFTGTWDTTTKVLTIIGIL